MFHHHGLLSSGRFGSFAFISAQFKKPTLLSILIVCFSLSPIMPRTESTSSRLALITRNCQNVCLWKNMLRRVSMKVWPAGSRSRNGLPFSWPTVPDVLQLRTPELWIQTHRRRMGRVQGDTKHIWSGTREYSTHLIRFQGILNTYVKGILNRSV